MGDGGSGRGASLLLATPAVLTCFAAAGATAAAVAAAGAAAAADVLCLAGWLRSLLAAAAEVAWLDPPLTPLDPSCPPPPAFRNLAFVKDPDGYWIEILTPDNSAQFADWPANNE